MEVVEAVSRKEEILSRAAELFMQSGYAATSVRDIARYLGMEAPSLYSHFKSKEDILANICFEVADTFLNKVSTAFSKDHAVNSLNASIHQHLEVLLKFKAESTVLWNEWKHLGETPKLRLRAMMEAYEEHFQTIIQIGIGNGEFQCMDSNATTKIILSTLNQVPSWYKEEVHGNEKQLVQQVTSYILNGIVNH